MKANELKKMEERARHFSTRMYHDKMFIEGRYQGYLVGSTDMINKACKWLEDNFNEYGQFVFTIGDFRKAIEENI